MIKIIAGNWLQSVIRVFIKVVSSIDGLFCGKKRVVFYAPAFFHANHLAPVVECILKEEEIDVVLVGGFDQIRGCRVYKRLRYLPLYRRYHAFVSTELVVAWWLSCDYVFFGHGVGPKLTYQASNKLKEFDYAFSPCKPIFLAHKSIGVNAKKIGLPVLDRGRGGVSRKEVDRSFGLNSGFPLLLYCPSWNSDPALISDVGLIISKLLKIEGFNLLVSPHPNLLRDYPELFEGDVRINLSSEGGYETLQLCSVSDIVISDISSILFEAIALQCKVAFDGNRHVYISSGAEKTLNEMSRSVPEIKWDQDVRCQLQKILLEYDFLLAKKFISSYLFNMGCATKSMICALKEIIG